MRTLNEFHHDSTGEMSVKEAKHLARKGGIKVCAMVNINGESEEMMVLQKSDFLRIMKEWPGDETIGASFNSYEGRLVIDGRAVV